MKMYYIVKDFKVRIEELNAGENVYLCNIKTGDKKPITEKNAKEIVGAFKDFNSQWTSEELKKELNLSIDEIEEVLDGLVDEKYFTVHEDELFD